MVTLAVPIYNMEHYLPRCMDSLLKQTSRDYEILLIDDGSTDSSGALCDSYAAQNPALIRVIHKENGGLSSARNAGIDHARGEFIVFPDPDDWVEQGYVELLVKYQKAYQAELVCLGHYVDTDTSSFPAMSDHEPNLLLGKNGQRGLLLSPKMEGFSWNKLYRLDIIRAHDLRFPDGMGTTEDLWFTYCYLAHCSRVCHAPSERIYHYCQRDDSYTQNGFSRDKMGTIDTYKRIIADCAEPDPALADLCRNRICNEAINLLWLHQNAPTKDAEVKKQLLSYIRRYLIGYLFSSQYEAGRKLQALFAACSPVAFTCLKNLMHKPLQ